MDTKVCSKCNKSLSVENFAFKNLKKAKLFAHCRACQKEYYLQHKSNSSYKASVRKAVKERNLRSLDYIRSLKNKPCVDCKQSYPHYVMDFDHLRDKTTGLSNLPKRFGWSKSRIDEEVAKCELVCSNCHRIRTWQRKEDHMRLGG